METLQKDRQCLLAFGANENSHFGRPEQTIRSALKAFDHESVIVIAVSRFFRTPAFPAGSGPEFVNAAALIESRLEPDALLSELHRIEALAGRVRTRRWGQRPLDIDLIACGDLILPDRVVLQSWINLAPEQQAQTTPLALILPHPRLQDRAFVLVPLSEIAPDWCHPLTGASIRQMLDALPIDLRAEVRPV
jgi:2-amino-4-hydroxy-6-hydroxymethyldihydropteridine diphosphokinase